MIGFGIAILVLLVVFSLFFSFIYLKKVLDHSKSTSKLNILLDREYYIHVKLKSIKNALLQKNDSEKDDLEKLFYAIEMIMDHKYHSIFNVIDDSYDNFVLENLNPKENNKIFLENIKILLDKANYHSITDKEIFFGDQESFRLTFPITPKFENISGSFLKEFNLKNNLNSHEYIDKMWIYCRGIDMFHMYDYFFFEKIDQLIIRFFKKIFQYNETVEIEEPKEEKTNIQRVPLILNFKNIGAKVTVAEPAYKEVIILYKNQNSKEVNIKYFQDIPIADLELIYPEVSISARPLDILKITFTFLIAVISLMMNLLGQGGNRTAFISLFSFTIVAIRVYIFLTRYEKEYNNLMIQLLSNKT